MAGATTYAPLIWIVYRNLQLLYVLRFIVHGWPVPERLRRIIGWHMLSMRRRQLQRLIRQARACASFNWMQGVSIAGKAEKQQC